MSIKNKQELIDLIKASLVEDLNNVPEKIDIPSSDASGKIQTIEPRKQLTNQAEKLANVMIEYVNAEIQNLFETLKKQNAYTLSNSNATYSNYFNGITIVPSEIKNYKPLIEKENKK